VDVLKNFIILCTLFFSTLSISEPFDKELETGKNYLFGINENKNEKLAIHWLKIAHNNGNNEGTYLLGYCFTFDICNQNNPNKGIDLLETAFKNGKIKAGYDLGIYFLKIKNISIAKNYFLKSQLFPLSAYNLGLLYINRNNQFHDLQTGVKFLSLALKFSPLKSNNNLHYPEDYLGNIYLTNQFNVQNFNVAHDWFYYSSILNSPYGLFNLANIYANISFSSLSRPIAYALYMKSSNIHTNNFLKTKSKNKGEFLFDSLNQEEKEIAKEFSSLELRLLLNMVNPNIKHSLSALKLQLKNDFNLSGI
jgi:TPR repeat protein